MATTTKEAPTGPIKIWDNHNKQWLEPMAIFFGRDNEIAKVQACYPGGDALGRGWYDIEGKDLSKISITGSLSLNPDLTPVVVKSFITIRKIKIELKKGDYVQKISNSKTHDDAWQFVAGDGRILLRSAALQAKYQLHFLFLIFLKRI